jgi:hypothetical protein
MNDAFGKRFRHLAGFGKRIEFWIIGQMLKAGLDVYIPLVDDIAIDAVIRRPNGSFAEVQIKARSKDVNPGDQALFAAIRHERRSNYWFILFAEGIGPEGTMWILSSEEFLAESYQNKQGKNEGLRTIWLNGKKRNKATGKLEPHIHPRFEKYIARDFGRLLSPIRIPE